MNDLEKKKVIELLEKALGQSPEAVPTDSLESPLTFKDLRGLGEQVGELSSPSLKGEALKEGKKALCGCALPLNSHNHTFFSVLDGISSPEDMVEMSAMRGYGGIGISDHGTMGGVLRAGRAGNDWKTGRFTESSRMFTYKKVSLSKHIKKYKLIDRISREPRADVKDLAYVLSGVPKGVVIFHPKDSSLFRLATKSEKAESEAKNERLTEVDVRELLKNGKTLCQLDWKPLSKETIDYAVSHVDATVSHDPDEPSRFFVVEEKDFQKVGDFKVLSGCELYVSWEKDKHKKYHHLTVYATGAKGHRALVLLSSIGAAPSRRFIGARGFFRPRVFIEDVEVAIKESGGELVVTTGCPISITSTAFKDGRLQEARDFFEWGVRVLPKGRFFAELHLCDVSLDHNRNFTKAEDRFFSAIFDVPVSRLKHQSKIEAENYAKLFHDRLRRYVLGQSLRSFTIRSKGSVRDTFQTTDFVEGSDLGKTFANEGTIYPLADAGIREDARSLFSAEELQSVGEIEDGVHKLSDELLKVAMEVLSEAHGQGQDGDDSAESDDLEASDPSEPSSLSGQTGTCGDSFLETSSEAAGVKEEAVSAGDGASVKSPEKAPAAKKAKRKKRETQLLDEDSVFLLSEAIKVMDLATQARQEKNIEKRTTYLAAGLLARFVTFVTTEIARNDNVEYSSPGEVIKMMLSVADLYGIGNRDDAEMLRVISNDRLLCFDLVTSGEMDTEILFPAVRALVAMLRPVFFDNKRLNPKGGEEDEKEKEWVIHPDGNWMERVNLELVKMAKEFDVPLLLATDAHMTRPDIKVVQDAIIKRGKRRAWNMSRPYAIPRSDLIGFIEDAGADYQSSYDYLGPSGNCAVTMLEKGCIEISDLIEAMGAGSLLLEDAASCGKLKWSTDVPKIKYENHKFYGDAKEFLDSGGLRAFLPTEPRDEEFPFTFGEQSISIATSLIVVTFKKAIEEGLIPDTGEYCDRLISELHLCQEVPNEQLADFFLVLQYVIDKWRDRGISVGPGRGSSGGMLIAMICGITYGDPIKKGFLATRWMNPGRKAMGTHADIDIDVSDRQLAGYELAKVARESFLDELRNRPLSPLEEILHGELFYSSAAVTHEQVGGVFMEVARKKKDLREAFSENLRLRKAATLGKKKPAAGDENSDFEESDGPEADSLEQLIAGESGEEGEFLVKNTPLFRVGTYGSLKAKAAVKEAVRIADNTPIDLLPSFAVPTNQWLQETESKIQGLQEEAVNRLYEEQFYGHLSQKERTARRRVKLGDRITKAMNAGSGLARLYQSERDYFNGSVYGTVPDYWDPAAREPSGSDEAKAYFDSNPEVKELVLDMLNIYKSQGVHAGGMCFGREAFERVPVRADKHGYVAAFEMKDIEKCGVLKFDVLGLDTLTQIAETLKMVVAEEPYENLEWWMTKEDYEKVKAGASPDILWRNIPKSTFEAAYAMCNNRSMTFQIDTKVFARELDRLDYNAVARLIESDGMADVDFKNEKLVDILNALCALFRPGPMKLNSHVEYIARLTGKPYKILHPWLAPFVNETFGLIVYQEQVMAIWKAGAKGTDEETDNVRRAMGKKDVEALNKMDAEGRFSRGLKSQGVPEEVAREIWDTISPFAEYGFNSPHSYAYGLISDITLFSKAHLTKYFFRVVMGLAKPEDAARFLGEIQDKTRPPCILRSEELYWEVIGDEYFPGLLTVEGLKRKDVDRILGLREGMTRDELMQFNPEQFFARFGLITESLASTLSRSGLLRALGTPDQIADGYVSAIVNHIKPSLAKKKAEAKEMVSSAARREMIGTGDRGDGEDDDDEFSEGLDDAFAGLTFDVRKVAAKKDDDENNGADSGEDDQTGVESFLSVGDNADGDGSDNEGGDSSQKGSVKRQTKAYKLGKKDESIVKILRERGLRFVDNIAHGSQNTDITGGVLTVDSAYDLVISNKTKGAGVRYLLSAIAEREIQSGKTDDKFVMLKDVKLLRTEDGEPLPTGRTYRTVAIPKAVSNFANYQTGVPEPRITFLAEGTELNAKFSNRWSEEEIEEATTMLKDAKMKLPFIVTLFAGSFSKGGQNINYYKIDAVEKIDGDKKD